jgi:hypothetical protein
VPNHPQQQALHRLLQLRPLLLVGVEEAHCQQQEPLPLLPRVLLLALPLAQLPLQLLAQAAHQHSPAHLAAALLLHSAAQPHWPLLLLLLQGVRLQLHHHLLLPLLLRLQLLPHHALAPA